MAIRCAGMSFEIVPSPASNSSRWRKNAASDHGSTRYSDTHIESEVGDFRQGSPMSKWALSRYLLGRVIGEYIANFLLVFAVAVFALAALVWFTGPHWFAVLIGIFAAGVLVVRWAFDAILHRLTGAGYFGPIEQTIRTLVHDTRGDMQKELRRIGVPSHLLTMPLLATRLASRKRRRETLARLRQFEIARAVSASRLDELHMALDQLRPRAI